MTDLELLVKPDQLPAFVKLLQELGYKPSTPLAAYETYLRSGGHHLPRFVKVHAPSVEVHWSLYDRDEPHSLDVEALWERAQICSIQDESVIGLSPEDLLIHVALHATNRHLLRQGIGLLCDVDAIVRHHDRSAQTLGAEEPQFDWATVVARAKACGGERGLFLALFLAERLLGTPIPSSLSAALGAPAIDERSLQDILAHLFVDNRAALRAQSGNAQRLSAQAHPLAKVHYLWRRLFVPREQLALTYQIRENSSWLYLYYGKRFKDLVTGYLKTRDQMQQTEPFLRDVALQQVTILRWLEGAN